jgi:hypothetical protein
MSSADSATETGRSSSTRQAQPGTLVRGGFVAWLIAATISAAGDGALLFALAWTASGHGAGTVTVVLLAGLVPQFLLTLVGGTAADQWGLRRTMIGCAVTMCLLLAGYAVATWFLDVTGLLLATFASAVGVVDAFDRPANNAFPRLFFTPAVLARGMSLTGSAMELARIVGPPLGAVLVVAISLNGVALVDLATFLLVLTVLVTVRPPYEVDPAATGSSRPAWHDLRAGLRAAGTVPGVGPMLVAVGLVAGTVIPMLGLCVPLLARHRGWEARDAGLIEACWIVGALSISLVVAKFGVLARPIRALVAGPLILSVGTIATASAPDPVLGCLGAVVIGVGTSVFTSHLFPLYLLRTPEGMLARFQSALIAAQLLAMTAGNVWLGAVSAQVGAVQAMSASAAGCACAGAVTGASATLRAARTPTGERST